MSIPAASRFPISTAFGLGYLKPASGSWGSLLPVAVAMLLILVGSGPVYGPWTYHAVLIGLILVFGLACVVSGDRTEAQFGKKDPSQVVGDEVVGMSIALIALPVGWDSSFWAILWPLVAAFLVFRFFDITKIPPANLLQRLPGGWGILLDDVAAGLWALLVLQIFLR